MATVRRSSEFLSAQLIDLLASNIRLNTNQCVTICPPISGCPFPPPTVPAGSPPPVCNGTTWLVASINSTGTIIVDQDAPLVIIADFTQDATGTLEIYVDGDGRPVITVDGTFAKEKERKQVFTLE